MKLFTNTFTQGGQTQLHKLHMLQQIMGTTFKISAGTGLLVFLIMVLWELTFNDLMIVLSYEWASLVAEYGGRASLFKNVMFPFPEGKKVVSCLWLSQEPTITHFVSLLWDKIISGFFWGLTVSIITFCGTSYYWVNRGIKTKEKKVLSGTEEVSDKTLAKLIRKKGEASDLSLAGVPLIKNKETSHMLIIGTTGCGKTNAFHEILQQIRGRNQRAIIVDMTGVFVEKYYRSGIDKILNPRDVRSEKWTLWGECQTPSNQKGVASILIPDSGNPDGDYWVRSSRSLIIATMEKLQNMGELTTKKFFEYVSDKPLTKVQLFYEDTKAAVYVSKDSEKTAMGIRSNIRGCMESIELFEDTPYPFSIREWVKNDGGEDWLFLSSPPEITDEVAPLMNLWTSIATEALKSMSRDLDRRLWVIIDELPAIQKLPKLHTMLAEVRQRGGCVIIGTQDMCLLDKIYGYDIVKSISNLCSTKVIFTIEGADIAERMSRWLGVQEVSESIENISYGANTIRDGVALNDMRKEKPTIHYDRLMKLPRLEAYLKVPGDYPVARIKFKIHDLPKIAEGFLESKY